MRLATMQGRQAAAEPHHPIGFRNMILFLKKILFSKKYGKKILFGKKYRKKIEKSIAKKYLLFFRKVFIFSSYII